MTSGTGRWTAYLLGLLFAAIVLPLRGHAQVPDFVPVAVEPKLTHKANLTFPDEALGSLVTGRIWIKIQVGRDGTPVKTDIIKREPDIAYMFDEVARRWAMECRFSPAIDSSGKPVAVWVSIPLNFKIQDFVPPSIVRLAVPDLPDAAREMGMDGWVGVAILVSETGSVLNSKTVIVAREPLSTKVFDEAAIAAAKASEFQPAVYNGRKSEAWCFVKVVFKIPEK